MEEMKVYMYNFAKEEYYEETSDRVQGLDITRRYFYFSDMTFLELSEINMILFEEDFSGYFCSFKKLNKREIEKLGKMVWNK